MWARGGSSRVTSYELLTTFRKSELSYFKITMYALASHTLQLCSFYTKKEYYFFAVSLWVLDGAPNPVHTHDKRTLTFFVSAFLFSVVFYSLAIYIHENSVIPLRCKLCLIFGACVSTHEGQFIGMFICPNYFVR
jgi:hypothetical protein